MRLIKLFLVFIPLVSTFSSYAGRETYSNRRDVNSTPALSSSTVYETYDDKYFEMSVNPYWGVDFVNHKVINKVQLGLNAEIQQSQIFTGTVDLRITYHEWIGGAFSIATINRTLQVSHDMDGSQQIDDLSTAVFSGGHYVKVEVVGVTNLNLSDVYLETTIDVERYYTFDGSSVLLSEVEIPSLSPDYIDFSWETKLGAEYYELEWVHVNDYTMSSGVSANPNTLKFDFYLNSTRVQLKENHYRIPKIFDRGYLVFRVRAVGMAGSNYTVRWEGLWDAPESGTIDQLASNHYLWIQTEYDVNMNWTHQVGYAEDGKRMEGVSFIDGLGRGRQSVVSNPVTNQVIVSNVYYDEMGRAVISDLPTPVDNEHMHHFENFNLSNTSGNPPFSNVYFDDHTDPEACPELGLGFSTTSGAGKYYSTSNPDKEGPNANIPDAEHYPFSRVTYLNDFSGRVDRVSSAGDSLAQGRGHETRFIYPSSSEYELNALFGTEVGLRGHYEKMITVDGNGQAYVQYSDMAGRVVASYLMGPSPASLDPLEDSDGEIAENVLIENGAGQQLGSPLPSTTFEYVEYMAEEEESYTFNYAFTPAQYQSACLSEGICFDCVYDLEFKIQDECGNVIVDSKSQINGETFDMVCNTPGEESLVFTFPLPKGVYTISKKLSVNRESADAYWCSYIDNSTCAPAVSDIFNELYLAEEFVDCDQAEIYEEPETYSGCSVSREMMLEDMSPLGQYGLYSVNTNGVYSASSAISILNINNTTLGGNYTTGTYLDQNGSPILVANTLGNMVSPSALTLEEFITLFDPQWAEGLLVYHPEYCYLQFCESNSGSDTYDQLLRDTYTFGVACSSGYMAPPTGSIPSIVPYLGCSSTSIDPFFSGTGSAYATQMANLMNSYVTIDNTVYSMWQMAVVAASCPGVTTASAINTCLTNFRLPDDECLLDLVWVNFRGMYLEAKAGFVLSAQQASCSGATETNECIGNPSTACTGNAFVNSISRFGNVIAMFGNLPNDPVATEAEATAQAAEACEQTCANYADQWISQFSGCNLSTHLNTTQLIALRTELIELCSLGCDLEHPSGATTAPPMEQTANGNTTINEVLEYHLGLVNVTFVESDFCSELLVSSPGPYQTTSELVGTPSRPLDECACEEILQAEYDLANSSNLPTGVNTLEEVLSFNTGVSLEDAHHLLCACDKKFLSGGVFDPNNIVWLTGAHEAFAASGYEVPTSLSCVDLNGCVDCATVNSAVTALNTRFSGIQNFTQSANYTVLLTNYLNNTFSFDLGYGNYSDFIAGCNASTQAPVCQTSPLADEWMDMMTLVAMRGTLMNTSANKVDLLASNIVFIEGGFRDVSAGKQYWSEQIAGTLNLHYGLATNYCTISLSSSIPNFDFGSIVSFETIYTSTQSCSSNPTFNVEVKYISCGQLESTILSGSSGCFNLVECICGNTGQLLCNIDSPAPDPGVCYQPQLDHLFNLALDHYTDAISSAYTEFVDDYLAQCAQAFSTEDLSYTGKVRTYQYTLFYYDQAGNLIRTVAPQGVHKLSSSQNDAINTARASVVNSTTYSPAIEPAHNYQTNYHYNSYNQLINTTNPDQEGATKYWYDRYGRIVASQNPVQLAAGKYSYSLYDTPGRPIEVGQVVNASDPLESDLKLNDKGAAFKTWVMGGARSEVTITTYDRSLSGAIAAQFAAGQQNLRLRVATVAYFETVSAGTDYSTDYTSATHYSYDVHGNVVEQLQDVPMLAPVEQDLKSTQYTFELLSGNVKKVEYQKDKPDQMTHEYIYDKLNRLQEVFTSVDASVHKTRQAHYRYYDYGPLARVELGQYKVQGMDYAYTINGWIKGMNSSLLNNNYDMGKDGKIGYLTQNTDVHQGFAKDVSAYTLGYFNGDYKAIDVNSQMEASYYNAQTQVHSPIDQAAKNLYNGNIRSLVTSIYNIDPTKQTLGTAYRYDQLQRLKSMTAFYYTGSLQTTNDWFNEIATQDYYNAYTYDKNGNIRTLQRNSEGNNRLMDNFVYTYIGYDGMNVHDPSNPSTQPNNRLNKVADGALNDANNTGDIKTGQNPNNYQYDALGQLTHDEQEGIQTIEWTYGDKKIKKLTRMTGNTSPDLEFKYNPFGQRVVKIKKPRPGGNPSAQTEWEYTYYAYDANGQVMATYEVKLSSTVNKVTLDEQHIYGASRLGLLNNNILLFYNGTISFPTQTIYQNTLGKQYYEITNYLGNVNAVINDRKTVDQSGGATSIYLATVISSADYYPFGALLPGRHSGDLGRYGYNGKEADNEIKGNGNSYDFGARMHDPRLGRFLSLDPYASELAHISPYAFASNSPLFKIDPDGNWDIEVHSYNDRKKYGYAILIVKNNSGDIIYQTKVRVNGSKNLIGKARNITNGDTPQGKYKILEWRKTGNSRYPRLSFGPNDLLALEYKSGEGGSRQGMHLHGGRQEAIQGYTPGKNLANTHGCIRIKDSDLLQIKKITTELEKNDPTEKKGILTVKDDLMEVNGQYILEDPISDKVQELDEIKITFSRSEPRKKLTRDAEPIEVNYDREIIPNQSTSESKSSANEEK